MKVEFYVEGIYYHPENPIPSVVIVVRNNMDSMNQEPIITDSKSDMKKALKEMFLDHVKTHKTSFLVGLDDYRKSGIMVGDRLEIDMRINNMEKFAE